MNNIKLILLFFFFCCTVSLNAQDTGEDAVDPYKEIYDLKNKLEKRDATIKELEKKVAKIEAERAKADSLLKEEKATGKSKELKTQKKELEQENKRLKAELEKCSSDVEMKVSQQTKNLHAQITQLLQQHTNDSLEIASLKEDLSELTNFRKLWLAQLAESVNEKWLEKPYSQINMQDLENALTQYEEFALSDKKIADARDKLKALLRECQIYNQGIRIINAPYDKAQINAVVVPLKNLRDKVSDPANKKELGLLYWQVDNYGVTVEIFQDVIKAVENQIAEAANSGITDHKSVLRLVNKVLKKQEEDNEYISAIKKNPCLSEQYAKYYNLLQNDCISKNSVRDMIMNLQP